MTRPVLNKIWTFLAVLLLYFSINVWSITQQWQLSLPGDPFKNGGVTAHSVTLYGIPLSGLIFVALLLMTRWYGLARPSRSWPTRFPRFADLDFDPNTAQGRIAQSISAIAFVAVPMVALLHFYVKFLEGTSYHANDKPFVSGLRHLTTWISLRNSFTGGYYYDRDSKVLRGQVFAPFWEPWLFTFWLAFVFSYAFYCMAAVFWPNGIWKKR